jgi:hypothetical protein
MGIIKQVAEALKDVAEGIDHIRTVAKAVRDGRDYLKLTYPEVQQDLAVMCAEMRNTSIAVAAASAILTHFRFTVAGSALDTEPARFNEHLIAHKEKAALVSTSLRALRGHCHVIEQHVDQLRKRANTMNLSRLLLLFGLDSAERDWQVAAALKDIYDEEMQGYRLVGRLSISLQLAIDDVAKALGAPGTALPANVPAAAALLGEYADAFSALETTSNYLVLDLQESIDVLEGRV